MVIAAIIRWKYSILMLHPWIEIILQSWAPGWTDILPQQLIYMDVFYDGMSPSSKQIWCFGCNSMQRICLHKGCPQHCDMCNRIKEIRLNTSTHRDLSI